MEMASPNWAAIIVMALVYMGLGWLWWSPMLFGNVCSGCCSTKGECKSCGFGCMIGTFIIACIMGYVMDHLTMALHTTDVMMGARLGFWMWLGFIGTTMFSKVLWSHKPMKTFLVGTGFYLVMLMIMGATFSVWR